MTDKDIRSLSESIDAEVARQASEIESKTSERFNELVESITRKFDDQVNNVIVENVKANVGKTINAKMYGIIKDIVGLLENAGIATTETTKELQKKMKVADEKLEQAFVEREAIKKQLDVADVERLILTKTKGMKPAVINAALDYFRGETDPLKVMDDLDAFLDGDFSQLMMDNGNEEYAGAIKLDDVKNALNGLDVSSEVDDQISKKDVFESLGHGLKQSRALGGSGRNANVTTESLDYASEHTTLVESEDDAKEALSKIDDFNNLGYKFK